MNLKFPAILVSDCSTEDVCHCPGAENLDHYCNGSISSHLEIRAIESHLLVCKSCQLKLEELDVFVATLRESEFFLKASPPPTEPRRLLLPAGLYPLASLALIFALAMLFLMIRVPEPSTNFKQLSLTSTRSASVDTQLAAKALTLDIDSPALITTLPYSLRLLSSDGFIVKNERQNISVDDAAPQMLEFRQVRGAAFPHTAARELVMSGRVADGLAPLGAAGANTPVAFMTYV